MEVLKNKYRLCSEGSLRELTGEMAYELWIFFSLKSLSSQSPKKFYIVHIEENENSFNYPPSVVHYLFCTKENTQFSCTANWVQLPYDQSKHVSE